MKKNLIRIYFSGLLVLPLVLLVLPADFFDTGQSVCLSVLLFHQTCYGCGITRAVQHLIHLDFTNAYLFNKLSFIVAPLLLVAWWQELRRLWKQLHRPEAGTGPNR